MSASGGAVLHDTTHSGANVTCTGLSGSATSTGGAHSFVPATPVSPYTGYDAAATISALSLTSCTGSPGTGTITTNNLPWGLGCTATTLSGGTVTGCTGYLYGVSAHIAFSTCSWNVSGVIYGTYNNTTNSFTTTTTTGLTTTSVTGTTCPLIPVTNGDTGYLATTLTFTPGFTISPDYSVAPAGSTAQTVSASGGAVLHDTTHSGANVTCTGLSGSATSTGGAHSFVPATPVSPYTGYDAAATISALSLTSCTGSPGTGTITTNNLPWGLGCTATTLSGGTVTGCTGYLYGVSAHIAFSTCSWNVSGVIYGTYNNTTNSFTTTTTTGLTTTSVTGTTCPLIPVTNGDTGYLATTLTFTPGFTLS